MKAGQNQLNEVYTGEYFKAVSPITRHSCESTSECMLAFHILLYLIFLLVQRNAPHYPNIKKTIAFTGDTSYSHSDNIKQ